MNFNKRKKTSLYLLLIVVTALLSNSCHRVKIPPPPPKAKPISFKTIAGIDYTEVRRRLSSGLSFDDQGFEAEPSYKITFLKNDSASVYSPDKKAFINFLVFLEPDSIFNVARSYFKLKYMSRDSLLFQVLEVEGDTLHMKRSLVYMTFYANNYIKNVLHTDAATLGKPDRNDTLFIQKKALQANKIPDSAFAARQPVVLKSKNPNAIVQREAKQPDVLNNFDPSNEYMSPEYNITINKAYEDFSYSFTVFVDDKGGMHFGQSLIYIMPEYKESTINTLKAIIDGYLKFYLQVTPGSTLGIVHTSTVILNVVGRKG